MGPQLDGVGPGKDTGLRQTLDQPILEQVVLFRGGLQFHAHQVDARPSQRLLHFLQVLHDGHVGVLLGAILEKSQVFRLHRRLDDGLVQSMGVAVQHGDQLGQMVPSPVNVEKFPVAEGALYVFQLFHMDAAGFKYGVDVHQRVDLLGRHGFDILLPAQVSRLGAIVEGVEHPVGGRGQVTFENIPAHFPGNPVGLDGVLSHIAAPGTPVYRDEHLLFLQLAVQVGVDLPVFFFAERGQTLLL